MRGLPAFFSGATVFFRGLGFLRRNTSLIPVLIVPTILTTMLYVAIIYLAFTYFGGWIESVVESDAWYAVFLKYAAKVVVLLLLLATAYLTFIIAGSILCAPFNEYLSQKVEAALIPGISPISGGIGGFLWDVWLTVCHECLRWSLFLLLMAIIFTLNIIPVVGQIVWTVLAFYISVRYLAWDGLDYSLARRRLRFREKWAFLGEHRARTLGFGVASFLLYLIPLTVLFVIPLAAISGTVLYCEIKNRPGDIAVDHPAEAPANPEAGT